MVGGMNGIKYEVYYRQIEDLFYQTLDDIKLVFDNILDIANSAWLKDMQKFRDSMTKLENIVKNLINRTFKEVKNIEEGIEAIYAFRSFEHKKCLRHALLIKWIQVWKIFAVEINNCSNSLFLCKMNYPLLQHHSKNATILCNRQYLKQLFSIMTNASDWIGNHVAEKLHWTSVTGAKA
ncbi:hypothetical protein DMN91_003283 [Ooceraea biroi]|uniref:Dynein heavy chain tail domain-containing protein n=1 Tax=Ooceraea biroi TaxID=2015173 RepID=A0A3L8DXL7_OOCBI|nr:hypothetical protein DMN91_003283 [Ooceraea biroi]